MRPLAAGGHIVYPAPVGAYEVVPIAAAYCATKLAVCAISEGASRGSARDIRVTVISPGVIDLNSPNRSQMPGPATQ